MTIDIKNNRSTQDVDVYAGIQLRKRRQELKISQKTLAEKVYVTFQQIQKYEKGLNRIGVSRLYEFCQILQVKPSYFFQDFKYNSETIVDLERVAESDDNSDYIVLFISKLKQIKDPEKKKLILDLLNSIISNNK
jgi:transcriptional regulator with XRE-family HTH domain